MDNFYTNDKSTQIVLALLKAHGIKKVIASPGTTNIALVASMQYDSWFEMYSAVDERSAAYMACGLASESGEPVVITCTEATASRNYYPGLTEAHYRKLPILAITGTHGDEVTGHLNAQSIDRSQTPNDTINFNVSIRKIKDKSDEWLTTINVNKAILELRRNGGGPVLINLHEATGDGFDTQVLPPVRKIERIFAKDSFPRITDSNSVAIFVGSHKVFTDEETFAIESFCEKHNGVVFVDHTSNYYGKYKVQNALLACQNDQRLMKHPSLLIHIGEVSGEIYNTYHLYAKETWRVSEDGEIRDLFKNLSYVFQMDEQSFFAHYSDVSDHSKDTSYYEYLTAVYDELLDRIPDLPFGNIWAAQQLHGLIPKNSYLHTSIFNSLRSWNFFKLDDSIRTGCNVGGFGIDGSLSTILGSSLANPDKLHYCIIGDLAFFYDMNTLGNRHLSSNIRILLVNNGVGTEFKNYDHPAAKWQDRADNFMAARGHFGCKSHNLVKSYAEALGFKYLSANNKDEFNSVKDEFVKEEISDQPIIFEIFTKSEDESEAIRLVRNIVKDNRSFTQKVKGKVHSIVGKIIK